MSAVLTHCKRELMHAIWLQLLNDDFVDAYTNRMLIECADGTIRRFFPQLFTYSADYLEKYELFYYFQVIVSSVNRTLLTCIKMLGRFPCLRCVISKDSIAALGTKSDMWKRDSDRTLRIDSHTLKHDIEVAQKWIYIGGKPLTSKHLEDLLGTKSLVPTRVCAHSLLSWYPSIDFLSECILCKAWTTWPWFLYNVCSRSTTRVRTRCMESSLHTLDMDFVRHWWGWHPNAEQTVR